MRVRCNLLAAGAPFRPSTMPRRAASWAATLALALALGRLGHAGGTNGGEREEQGQAIPAPDAWGGPGLLARSWGGIDRDRLLPPGGRGRPAAAHGRVDSLQGPGGLVAKGSAAAPAASADHHHHHHPLTVAATSVPATPVLAAAGVVTSATLQAGLLARAGGSAGGGEAPGRPQQQQPPRAPPPRPPPALPALEGRLPGGGGGGGAPPGPVAPATPGKQPPQAVVADGATGKKEQPEAPLQPPASHQNWSDPFFDPYGAAGAWEAADAADDGGLYDDDGDDDLYDDEDGGGDGGWDAFYDPELDLLDPWAQAQGEQAAADGDFRGGGGGGWDEL